MKYIYAYKTSDGLRHEDAMEASSRDAVFIALRRRGIKAIKVVAADGSKANGEVRGIRKRVVAVGVLVLVVMAIVAGVVSFRAGESNASARGASVQVSPRHQIYGDPVIVSEFERGNFELAFTNRVDQLLAWFAQPGKLMCPRGIVPNRVAAEFSAAVMNARVENGHGISAEDPREVRELKQIVNGMHEELSAYLANGNGTPASYWRRLLERTQQEMMIYERTRRELEKENNPTVWEEKNEALRNLGIRTIPNPKDKGEE